MIAFGLKEGMTAAEILAELRGRVSGETQLEALSVFTENKDPEYAPPTHEIVLKDDTNHAMLLKREVSRDWFGKLTVTNRYFLTGINDEGMYFVHEINLTGPQALRPAGRGSPEKPNLESILAWINRGDQGFSHRIQGDILMQYISTEQIQIDTGYGSAHLMGVLNLSQNLHKNHPPNSIQLGNHRVSTDGTIYAGGFDGILAVVGSKLIIQHPQHALIEKDIPKNHVVILAGQRGRNQTMGGGFD